MKDLIEALTVFLKYKNEEWPTHCEHDVMMIAEVKKQEVSDEDLERLEELGFNWDPDEDCFMSFRFGSA